MKFFKIFLICLGSLIGVTGIAFGILYLTGYFNEEQIFPNEISFSSLEYNVEDNFKMMITSPTEDVNVKGVTLSFEGIQSTGNTITDGVISLPRYVRIGEEFDVEIVKSVQDFNGETVEWINGGISNLVATSANINARKAQAKVFVDVPVYDIDIKTSTSSQFTTLSNTFNIDSTFFVRADFLPEKSKYKYSKDESFGVNAEYKSVFFSSMSTALEKVDIEGLDRYVSKYKALIRAENVEIVAQCFKNSSTEISAYESVANFAPDIAYNNLLNIVQTSVDNGTGVSSVAKVNFSQLVVGSFNADTTNIVPSSFNKYTRIYINKANLLANEYSLNANVLATDNLTLLPEESLNLALAVLLETGTGFKSALLSPNQNADINLLYDSVSFGTIKNIVGVSLYKPIKNFVDVNQSYWEITPLKENLNIRLALVLLDDEGVIKDFSYLSSNTTEPKYLYQIQTTQVQSSQVYWTEPLTETKTLFIYDSKESSERVFEEYDLKNNLIFIPDTNTYHEVRYFAYLEGIDGNVDNTTDLSNFVITTGQPFETSISSGVTAKLYELPNGVITPKYNNNELNGKVKVLFATVQTDHDGNVLITADGKYIIDRFSSNSSIGTPQTMSFGIERTLNEVGGKIIFLHNKYYNDVDGKVFAVKTNVTNAFILNFNIDSAQKSIFIRDYNAGKISVDFYINGTKNNDMFACEDVNFNEMSSLQLVYSVAEFDYQINDLGYRNIEVRISYKRGNGSTAESVVNSLGYDGQGSTDTSSYKFQVYDGKISQIYFSNIREFESNLETNAINVTTTLTKAKNGAVDVVEDGVYLAQVGSNFAIEFNTNDVKSKIFDDSNVVRVSAKDKYGFDIRNQDDWILISSDENVLVVDNVTKTISFVGSSSSAVSLSVQTLQQTGEGNKQIFAVKQLWFKVQTGGQIVKVTKNTNSVETIFDNIVQQGDENVFLLKDENLKFTNTAIEMEIIGKQDPNKTFSLISNDNNLSSSLLLDIYYGIANADNKFEVFNLRRVLNWTISNPDEFNNFIEFTYIQDSDFLSGFKITRNFGKIATLNLQIQSDIGVNFNVQITITPYIDVAISGTYGHENEGASTDIASGNTYIGAYAQKSISVSFNTQLNDTLTTAQINNYKIIWYLLKEGQESTIIDWSASRLTNLANSSNFEIEFSFPDVIGNEKYQVVMVLDSRNADSHNYEKLPYDYSRTLYFNVNPNIKSELVGEGDGVKELSASSSTVANDILYISTNDTESTQLSPASSGLINVERKMKLAEQNLSSTGLGANGERVPYVYVLITNSLGIVVNNQYFVLENNSLKIREGMLLAGSQEVYISVFFGNNPNATELDSIIETYKFVISPSLLENDNLDDDLSAKMGFVTYDGRRYLQITPGEYMFGDITKCFSVGDGSQATISASFEDRYINLQNYWRITVSNTATESSTINIYSTTQILVDRLSVKLTIDGVGIVDIPIIIIPQLAQFVKYDQNSNSNNNLANSDLYINQTINELVTHNIYNTINDGESYSIFIDETAGNNFGIIKEKVNEGEQITYSYYILDGNGDANAINFATINSSGVLTIDFVGEDSYIIVVAVKNNFRIYYRLKIVASLKLEAFYPYVNNIENNDLLNDRAEYVLFKSTDISRTIDLTSSFEPNIPATKEKFVIKGKDVFVNSRFTLFRYEGDERIDSVSLSTLSINISSIKRGNFGGNLVDVSKELWSQYAVLQMNNGQTEIIIYNLGNFVIELTATTISKATVNYTVVVEQSNKNYTLVDGLKEDGSIESDITKMPVLSSTAINMTSPIANEDQIQRLDYIFLKLTSGSVVSNRTSEMGYTLVGGEDYLRIGTSTFDGFDVVCLFANYSPNDINAKIVFWNKYGVIGQRDIKLTSITKVVKANDREDNDNDILTSLDFYSGTEINLNDYVSVAIKNAEGGWDIKQIVYSQFEFDKNVNYLLNKFSQSNTDPTFVILPLNQGFEDELRLTATVVISDANADENGIENQTFTFSLIVNIHSGFSSNAPNSANPIVDTPIYAGSYKEIFLFDSQYSLFGAQNPPEFVYDSENDVFSTSLENENYYFVYEIISGNQYIDNTVSFETSRNKLTLSTTAVASEIVVVIKFSMNYEKGEHRFALTSYYQFNIRPDSEIQINYPSPNGQEYKEEKIHYSDTFNLNQPALFSDNERIKINFFDGGKEIKIMFNTIEGKVNIKGADEGQEITSLDTNFTFDFNGIAENFAVIEYNIFVSGIQRATYTLEVYKNYNSLYSITVNTLNEKDGQNEVFYIADGRVDIFNGIQALMFNVTNSTSLLANEVSFKFYNDRTLLGEFKLNSTDNGSSKTIRLEPNNNLEGLTLANIRFTVNDSVKYYTLKELSEGETSYFTKDASGKVNFALFTRIRVQYLGEDVTEYSDFIEDRIKLIYNEEGAQITNPKSFKIDYQGLGEFTDENGVVRYRTEIEKVLNIVYNNSENNLGIYNFKVKSNVDVTNLEPVVITAGESKTKLLDVFGVVDVNGNKIVRYDGTTPILPEIIIDGTLRFDIRMKEFANGVNFKYLNDMTNYTNYSPGVSHPLTYATRIVNVGGKNLNADFEVLAYGAPNAGLYAEMIFSWTYKVSNVKEEDIYFEVNIPFNILPNTRIILTNLDGSSNSDINPQVFASESYDAELGYVDLTLINKNNNDVSRVYSYKTNITSGNLAYDLIYSLNDNISSNQASLIESADVKTVRVFKPDFATRDISINISDAYGYYQTYYIKAQPDNIISFVSLSNLNAFYEGDSFALKTDSSLVDADHELRLNKDSNYQRISVSYRLLTTDGTDLNAVSNPNLIGASTILNIKYLDSTIFSSTTKSVAVYLEITLKHSDNTEVYVINTDSFYLQQRYVSTVIDNSARDGATFILNDKISFTDRKIGQNVGEPVLTKEKTLIVNRENITFVKIYAKLKNNSSSFIVADLPFEATVKDKAEYVMLSEHFSAITSLDSYLFAINQVGFNEAEYNLNILLLSNNSKLKLNCLKDTVINNDLDNKQYNILLSDGSQYYMASNIKVNSAEFDLPETTGVWSIEGFEEASVNPLYDENTDNEPYILETTYEIKKEQKNLEYQTKLYFNNIDNIDTSTIITLKNLGQNGSVLSSKTLVLSDISKNIDGSWGKLSLNGTEKQIVLEGERYYVLLSEDQYKDNSLEKWVFANINNAVYNSMKNQLKCQDDKRLEIVTIDKYNAVTTDDITFAEIDVSNGLTSQFDNGKLKIQIKNNADADGVVKAINNINQIYVIASNGETTKYIYPADIQTVGDNYYEINLSSFGTDSSWNYDFYCQYVKNSDVGERLLRVSNQDKNINYDFKLVAGGIVALDITQGLWQGIYDKESPKTINILLNGDNRFIEVKLDKNGLQVFSMLQNGFDYETELNGTGVSEDDSREIKDLQFYNDTVEIKLKGGNSGTISLAISRERDGVVSSPITINVPIYSYANSYQFGLTDKFGDMPRQNDIYTITCLSKPNSYSQSLTICVPYSLGENENNEKLYEQTYDADFSKDSIQVVFTVDDSAHIIDNQTAIFLQSALQYSNNGGADKRVQITKYYIAKYRGAYYSLNPMFNVTPYFYGIVLPTADNSIMISDYTQTTVSVDGVEQVGYVISYENWTKNISFEDYYGNIITDKNGNKIMLQDVAKNGSDIARIIKPNIIETGVGSANIDTNGDIITFGLTDLVNNHITIHLQVALNGANTIDENGIETQNQWLDIATLRLNFNSGQQYEIKPNSSFIISNRKEVDDKYIETFKFTGYTGEENLSFNAPKLFADGSSVDFSVIRTISQTSEYGTKYYLSELADEKDFYQISYKVDDTNSVIVKAKATIINVRERAVLVYGLKKDNTITINARLNSNSEEYVTATWKNNTNDIFYGSVSLSSLTWEIVSNDPNSASVLGQDEIEKYNYFSYDENSASKCFVPLSYIDMNNIGLPSYYNGDPSSNLLPEYGDDKLISNPNFYYSNTFELTPANADETIRVLVPANTIKYYTVSQIGENNVILSRLYKLQNTENTNKIIELNLSKPAVLGDTIKTIILTDLKCDNQESVPFTEIKYMNLSGANNYYEITFGSESGEQLTQKDDISIYKKLLSAGSGNISNLNFNQYLYSNTVFDAVEFAKHNYVLLTPIQSENNFLLPTITGNLSVIANGGNYYEYAYYDSLSNLPFGLDKFEAVTIINGQSAGVLAWHEYLDVNLQNDYLFYESTVPDANGGEPITSTKSVAGKNLTMKSGEHIKQLWNGMYQSQFEINNNDRYIMKISDKDGNLIDEIYFRPNDFRLNRQFNAWTIYKSIYTEATTLPNPSEISFVTLNPDEFWTNAQDNHKEPLEEGYYEVIVNDQRKAVIYYNSDFTTTNIMIVVDLNIFAKSQLEFNKVYFRELFNNTESGYFMIDTEVDLQVYELPIIQDTNILSSLGNYLNSSKSITYRQIETAFRINLPDDVDINSFSINVSFGDSSIHLENLTIKTESFKNYCEITVVENVEFATFIKSLQTNANTSKLTFEITIQNNSYIEEYSLWKTGSSFKSFLLPSSAEIV